MLRLTCFRFKSHALFAVCKSADWLQDICNAVSCLQLMVTASVACRKAAFTAKQLTHSMQCTAESKIGVLAQKKGRSAVGESRRNNRLYCKCSLVFSNFCSSIAWTFAISQFGLHFVKPAGLTNSQNHHTRQLQVWGKAASVLQ